jgi:hypothetical protein
LVDDLIKKLDRQKSPMTIRGLSMEKTIQGPIFNLHPPLSSPL